MAGPSDPHQLSPSVSRLSNSARRAAKTSVAVAAAVMEPGETAELVVQGKLHGTNAVLIVTSTRVLAVDQSSWKPQIVGLAYGPSMTVEGWQDDRTASLVIEAPTGAVTVDQIRDRILAQEAASRIRTHAAESAAPPPPAN